MAKYVIPKRILKNGKSRYATLFFYDNTHCGAHVPLLLTMNESDREEPMKEEVNNENGEHAEVLNKVTYLSLSGDKDFASEAISRENFFLIGANTKHDQTVRVNSRYITRKTIFR